MAAFNFRRRETRRWWYSGVAMATAALLTGFFVSGASAIIASQESALTATCSTANTLDASGVNGGQSNFEIDAPTTTGSGKKAVTTAGANLTLEGSSPCLDWTARSSVSSGSPAPLIDGVLLKQDKPSGSGDDSFTQGTSENSTDPVISTGSIPPNKSDLQWFGIYREANTSGKFLNLFWSRVNSPSGTVDMDFELNKLACDPTAQDPSANCVDNAPNGQPTLYVTPKRSDGDKLITYDLAKGGTVPTISIYTWSGNDTSGSWTNGTVISGQGSSSEALGSINFSTIDSWNSGGLGSEDPLTFGEVSISYKALFGGGGSTSCTAFGSVYLKSRSSNTFTDELKDFIAPEPVQITNCTTLTTSASNQSTAQTIGGTITDTATLHDAQAPTNGVVFTAYGPFDPTTGVSADTCSDSNVAFGPTSPIALSGPDSSGNYSASVPASGSGSFTPTSAGRYEWVASYAYDGNNAASATSCGDSNEQSLVGPVTPTLETTASNGTTAQSLGGTISDTANLTGTANEPGGSPAGGHITFKAYYNDSTCADASLAFTSADVAVNGNSSSYGPVSFTPKKAGTYYWTASYSGDSPNTSPVSEACGGTNESSVVKPNTPTISTNATAGSVPIGTALDDTATLGNTSLEPDGTTKAQGTITFNLYGPESSATCATADRIATVTIGVNGNGDYKASNGTVTGSLTPTSAGTYYWTASYGGDSPNTAPISEACGGTNESSVVVKLDSTISTAQSWTPQDTATIDHSGGTVTFTLYKNGASPCTGSVVYGPVTVSVTGSESYTASTSNSTFSVSSVTAGDTYYWKAAYDSGDSQHKDVTSCTEATAFTSLDNGSPVTSP